MSQTLAQAGPAEATPATAAGQDRALFLVSVFGLFTELLLIRWIGTEVIVFSCLQNTVLVVCFLGLGMGCMSCRREVTPRDILLPLLALTVLLAIPFTRTLLNETSVLLRLFGAEESWADAFSEQPWQTVGSTLFGLGLLFALLMLVWDAFVPVGRLLGRLMDDHPSTIRAYSVNVAGSLAGVWLFVLLSALYLPPVAWFAVVAVLLLLLFASAWRSRPVDLGLLAVIVALAWGAGFVPGALETHWSPYQKLSLVYPTEEGSANLRYEGIGKYIVQVGPWPYQGMLDLSKEHVRQNPDKYPAEMEGLSQYDLPARMHAHPRKALIVGAGSGNDVAGVLRQGVDDVTAVDIDPVIIDLGKRYHPEHPYDSPRVRVVNDDARSFFANTPERYDLIVFGLLDAHTSTTMSNARLDHYVYTRQSLEGARLLLAKDGVLVLTFEVMKPYIPERMFDTLREVFGHDPVYFRVPPSHYGWGGAMFVIADDMAPVHAAIAADPKLSAQVARWQDAYQISHTGRVPVATDDWPYLYLETPGIPPLFFVAPIVLLALFARGWRQMGRAALPTTGWDRTHWHFLFLGAAFMLLEVQNISKASVALGSTWQVNAVIISGILALILVANLLVATFPSLPLGPVYLLFCVSCLFLYGIDLSRFNAMPYPTRAAVVGALTSLPMLFSGIIFIRSFVAVPHKDSALGANLIGALCGGLLQTLTFLTGLKALLLIVAALYVAALLTRPRVGVPAKEPATLEPASA